MKLSVKCTCKCVNSRGVTCEPAPVCTASTSCNGLYPNSFKEVDCIYLVALLVRGLWQKLKDATCHTSLLFFFSKQQYSFSEGYLREMLQARIDLSWCEIKKQQL